MLSAALHTPIIHLWLSSVVNPCYGKLVVGMVYAFLALDVSDAVVKLLWFDVYGGEVWPQEKCNALIYLLDRHM